MASTGKYSFFNNIRNPFKKNEKSPTVITKKGFVMFDENHTGLRQVTPTETPSITPTPTPTPTITPTPTSTNTPTPTPTPTSTLTPTPIPITYLLLAENGDALLAENGDNLEIQY